MTEEEKTLAQKLASQRYYWKNKKQQDEKAKQRYRNKNS